MQAGLIPPLRHGHDSGVHVVLCVEVFCKCAEGQFYVTEDGKFVLCEGEHWDFLYNPSAWYSQDDVPFTRLLWHCALGGEMAHIMRPSDEDEYLTTKQRLHQIRNPDCGWDFTWTCASLLCLQLKSASLICPMCSGLMLYHHSNMLFLAAGQVL